MKKHRIECGITGGPHNIKKHYYECVGVKGKGVLVYWDRVCAEQKDAEVKIK